MLLKIDSAYSCITETHGKIVISLGLKKVGFCMRVVIKMVIRINR